MSQERLGQHGDDFMEIKGKIEHLEQAKTKTDKTYIKLKVQGKSFNVFYTKDNNSLRDLEHGKYQIGSPVKITYEQNGQYPEFKNIEPTTLEQVQETKETKEAPDWNAKDRRIVRMASINAANELLRTNQIALPDEAKMISEVTLFKLAEMIENWVYRETPKTLGDIE
jgi:hypothetical protein